MKKRFNLFLVFVIYMLLLYGIKQVCADDITLTTLLPEGLWAYSTDAGYLDDIYNVNKDDLGNVRRVGIGTTTPSNLFTVSDDQASVYPSGSFDAQIGITNTNTTNNNGAAIAFKTNAGATTAGRIGTRFTSHAAGAVSGDLVFETRDAGTFGERMRIKSGGDVGIGTTAPGHSLAIVRDIGMAALAVATPGTDTAGDSRIVLNTMDTNENGGIGSGEKGWRMIARGNNYSTANVQNDLQINRVYGSPQVSDLVMHLNSEDGHVGIGGDTTPDATLTVKGETNDLSTTALNITKNNGNSILSVKNNGVVGIGTTSISGLLEICSKDGTLQLMLSDERAGIPAAHKQRSIRLYGGNLTFNKINGGVTTQMVIENDGKVGIGMDNPAHPLHMASGARCTTAGAWTDASDISHKKNIANLKYGLDEVLRLQPREYDMKLNGLHQIGFVGQEVEKVIPEVVSGEEGDKGIGYGGITALLVNAIKEQQKQIESQQRQIEELKKIVSLKTK